MRWYQILALVAIPGIIIGVVLLITPALSIDYAYAPHVPDEAECVNTLREYNSVSWHGEGTGDRLKKQFAEDYPGFKDSTCWENKSYLYKHMKIFHDFYEWQRLIFGYNGGEPFTHP